MPDIIRTIESWRDPRRVANFLSAYEQYFSPLGRGYPKRQPVENLWYCFRGRVYGRFSVLSIERNAGQFEEQIRERFSDAWTMKHDVWVVVCQGPLVRLREKVYYGGFQGWRYFDLESYRGTLDARHPI